MFPSHHLTEKNLVEQKVIINTDGNVILYPDFFNVEESNQLFWELYGNIRWKQEIIHLFGKKNAHSTTDCMVWGRG